MMLELLNEREWEGNLLSRRLLFIERWKFGLPGWGRIKSWLVKSGTFWRCRFADVTPGKAMYDIVRQHMIYPLMIESKVFSPNALLGWSFQVFSHLVIMTPVDMFQWRLFRQTVVWCPKNKLIAGSWMSIFAGPPELHKKAQVDVGRLDGVIWVFHKTDQVWTLGFVEVALPMSELMESLTASVVGVPQSKNGNEPSRAEVHSANPKGCLPFGETPAVALLGTWYWTWRWCLLVLGDAYHASRMWNLVHIASMIHSFV